MFCASVRLYPFLGCSFLLFVATHIHAAENSYADSSALFDHVPPVPSSFGLNGSSESSEKTSDAIFDNAVVPASEMIAPPMAAGTYLPYQMTLLTPPPAPPKPAAPKKPVPPAFPGPQTLPPVGPWKLMYFENDFSYKKEPNHEYFIGEELKDMKFEAFGIPMLLSTGGEVRDRYMNERNRLRPGGIPIGHAADYNLTRWRHYFDLKAGDFRVYFEGIEATSQGSQLTSQPIDVDKWDIQNLFADWRFYEEGSDWMTVRYGRQELSYGKQRLVSPLDWANTRRNFEGGRYIAKSKDYQFDLFCVHPVNSAGGYNSGTGFNNVALYQDHPNQPNYQVFFSGAYFNYTGIQNTSIDLYWLYLDTTTYTNPGAPIGSRHTIGGRYGALFPVDGGSRVWDFDTEGAIQAGNNLSSDVLAGFYTAIGGHTWKNVPWTPRVSGLFYYGSGSNSKVKTNGTFNTLFPLSHAYWGLSDNLNGENLFNYALQADVKPTQKLAITSAYHWFKLVNANDNLYTVSGSPLSPAAHGSGTNVGTSLDLYGYYAVNKAFDIQAGYSWFFFGDYFDTAAGQRPLCTQLYVQTTFRY